MCSLHGCVELSGHIVPAIRMTSVAPNRLMFVRWQPQKNGFFFRWEQTLVIGSVSSNMIVSVDQHGVVAIKRWPGLLGGDTSATSGKQFPPDLRGDLLVAVVQKQVQQSLALVFGDWSLNVSITSRQ